MTLTEKEFNELREFMYNKFGVNLKGKQVLIEGRLSSMLTKRGYTNFTDYIRDLKADRTGNEESLVVSRLTTNFTYFLRENVHYEFMTREILPNLNHRELNVWSAACSSGEEPYSIAMVATDYFTKNHQAVNIHINASDISNHVLTLAREGQYSIDMISKLPEAWVKQYMSVQPDGSYRVSDKLKKLVTFRYFNLMATTGWARASYDILFCRNVMIYFDQPTRQSLSKRLFEAVKPGGYLFIGTSESLVSLKTDFEYVKPAIYRKPL